MAVCCFLSLSSWRCTEERQRLFPLVSSPAPDPCSQLRAIDGSESPLLEVSFNCGTAAEQWSEGSTVLCNWISKPFSVQTWTKKCEEARQKMLHAALSARCSSAHRVLSSALPECSLETAGFFVYAIFSVFWGLCYVGGCGYKGPRPPLARWIDHIRLAKVCSSKTSKSRHASRCPAFYGALASVSP